MRYNIILSKNCTVKQLHILLLMLSSILAATNTCTVTAGVAAHEKSLHPLVGSMTRSNAVS